MPIDTWLTFVSATLLLLILPGPTILLVLSYALSQGRRVAVASAAGVAVGDFLAMTLSLAGLGALVLASATAFVVLKWIGAAYLMYLGVSLFRAAPNARFDLPDAAVTAQGVFGHAALVTALNPKSIAFFVAFVPQFVDTHVALLPQFVILISTFVTLATLNTLAYALAADKLRLTLKRPGALTWLTRAGGATLFAMGLLTLTLRRTSA